MIKRGRVYKRAINHSPLTRRAKSAPFTLADCRAAQVAALGGLPQTGAKYFTYDGVHPVWEGNKLIARAVLKALGVSWDTAAIEAAWQVMHEAAQ